MECYVRDGKPIGLKGNLFFADGRCSTLYFVPQEATNNNWGSAESGRYTLRDDQLTFQHEFTFQGSAATPLKIDLASTVVETCVIKLHSEKLTIHFPSGNIIHCRRFSE